MKRFLALGAAALSLMLASQQEASAWCNFKFGVGLNTSFSAGNNNFAWGLCRSGDPGSCLPPGCGLGGPAYGGFGYGGGYPVGGMTGYPTDGFVAPTPKAAPTTAPAADPAAVSYYPGYYNPYQPVNYGYSTMPFYYYPATYYGQ